MEKNLDTDLNIRLKINRMSNIVSDFETLGNTSDMKVQKEKNTKLFEQGCIQTKPQDLKPFKFKAIKEENIVQTAFMILILSDKYNCVEIDIPFVLSNNGRVKIPDASKIDLFDEFSVSLYPGDEFEATLYANMNVFTDENMLTKYLQSNDANEFCLWASQNNFRKEYVPIKTLINPPNTFKFFDNPISTSCLGIWGSFSVEIKITNSLLNYETVPTFKKRALSVKSYFTSPPKLTIKPIINPIEILRNHYGMEKLAL